MKTIAFVPIRSGSLSIKDKNIKDFNGKPLVYWSLKALQETNSVDEIIVALDSEKYKNVVLSFEMSKLKVYDREPENADDTASTESVMLEYLNKSEYDKDDTFVLVQATSPLTSSEDFEKALVDYKSSVNDSVLSCVRQKRFIWNKNGTPNNYDYKNRPRRQDFDGYLIENGAFYINRVGNILKDKNRLSGKIGIFEMPEYTAIEIDEPEDWIIAEKLMQSKLVHASSFKQIKLFLSDVDGVLTDAGMYYSENGDELKKFCTYDGMGFKLLQEKGVKVGIITSEDMQLNRRRAKKLKLDYDFHGQKEKLATVDKLRREMGICFDEIAYIGDDVNDFELLNKVGLAACPANAINKIKNIPNIHVLSKHGGSGAVREFVELIIKK